MAALGVGIVDGGGSFGRLSRVHMAPEEIHRDSHDLGGLEGASPQPGLVAVGADPAESVANAGVGVAGAVESSGLEVRVPVEEGIDPLETAIPGHVGFPDTDFLGRGSEAFDRAGEFEFFHHGLQGDDGGHAGRAKEIVPAPVARSPVLDGTFVGNRIIGKSRQSIVLGQDPDNRLPLSPGRLKGSGHPRHAFFNGEPLPLQFFRQ